jgi:hypothetical protein
MAIWPSFNLWLCRSILFAVRNIRCRKRIYLVTDNVATSDAAHNAQSVSIVLPTASMWLLGALILALTGASIVCGMDISAVHDLRDRVVKQETECRLYEYFDQNLTASLREHGFQVPLAPNEKASNK